MSKVHYLLSACMLLVSAAIAPAAPWAPDNGINGPISYANGQDTNGLFGTPEVADGIFEFATPQFFVAVAPGSPSSTSDIVSFNAATIAPTDSFQSVTVTVLGNYSIVGSPADVNYTATLTLAYAQGGGTILPLVFTPTPPNTPGSDEFTGTATLLLPINTTGLYAELFANVSASATEPGTSNVHLLNAQISFTTIPEPASLGLIGGIASMLLRRRR